MEKDRLVREEHAQRERDLHQDQDDDLVYDGNKKTYRKSQKRTSPAQESKGEESKGDQPHMSSNRFGQQPGQPPVPQMQQPEKPEDDSPGWQDDGPQQSLYEWLASGEHPHWDTLPPELKGMGRFERLAGIGPVLKNFGAFYNRTGRGVWWSEGAGNPDPELMDPNHCWDYW
jgi:hypothetical protein